MIRACCVVVVFFFVAGCTDAAEIARVPDGVDAATPRTDAAEDADGSASRDAGGKPCTTSADCAGGEGCGFLETDGCAATGVCLPATDEECTLAEQEACGCDGTAVDVGPCGPAVLPAGYASKPVAYLGECSELACGTPSDGGVGARCRDTSACGANELCAWPLTAGACPTNGPPAGWCVAKVEGCHCIPPAACGCDGQPAETGCSVFLPPGYSLTPFSHFGACTADAGSDGGGDGGACGPANCTGCCSEEYGCLTGSTQVEHDQCGTGGAGCGGCLM